MHHVEKVVERIQQTGATIRFLPPYSPDLNPAEEVLSKIKKFLVNNNVRSIFNNYHTKFHDNNGIQYSYNCRL